MKSMIFLLVCGCFCANVLAVDSNEPNSIDSLKTQITELKLTIEKQAAQISKLQRDNLKLKSLCRQAGIGVPAENASMRPISKKCVYKGRVRDSEWIQRMFAKYDKSIGDVNGQYVYIQEFLEKNSSDVKGKSKIPTGTIFKLPLGYKVLQVLNANEILIHRDVFVGKKGYHGSAGMITNPSLISVSGMSIGRNNPENQYNEAFSFPEIIHVKISGSYVDGEGFKSPLLIANGTYQYLNTLGAMQTIPNLEVYEIRPITIEQFIDALNSGLLLYDYVKNKDGVMEKHYML
ncbi:MAG: hypothetical protein ACYC54_11385 [Sedimentisphaerales bacterium]